MSNTNTNAPALPDLDAFFLNQGKPIGYEPTDIEIEIAKSILVPVTKELMMRKFAPPEEAVGLGTRTNPVTRDVMRTIEFPDGSFKPYEAQMLQTTDGYQELVAPGTVRAVTNVDTGAPAKGYVASGSFYAGSQQMVGQDNDAAKAAAAAATSHSPSPAQTPAPRAMPTQSQSPYTMTNAQGTALTFSNPYQVRQAFIAKELTHGEAKQALLHWGIK